jgi:hypothetical protein
MSELLSPFKEGYIYRDSLYRWIYLGLFNYLEADFIGNNTYKCKVMNNKPKFMDYDQDYITDISITIFLNELIPIGCTLESVHNLVESHKKEFGDFCKSNIIPIQNLFNRKICEYIAVMTLSKDNIKLPKDFEIVSSDNNSLILYIPNSLN